MKGGRTEGDLCFFFFFRCMCFFSTLQPLGITCFLAFLQTRIEHPEMMYANQLGIILIQLSCLHNSHIYITITITITAPGDFSQGAKQESKQAKEAKAQIEGHQVAENRRFLKCEHFPSILVVMKFQRLEISTKKANVLIFWGWNF